MARKLKTYQTSLGFFDMAIAAPSMKAALEAWGSKSNLFHQGFANEVDDPALIAATLAKPGVILRRPVGSDGPFREQADLPSDLSGKTVPPEKHRAKPVRNSAGKTDDRAARKAALVYEREEKQRESRQRKAEAAMAKVRERREQGVAKAQAAIEQAQRAHEHRISGIDAERADLEQRAQAEDRRWYKQKEKLDTALRRARE